MGAGGLFSGEVRTFKRKPKFNFKRNILFGKVMHFFKSTGELINFPGDTQG